MNKQRLSAFTILEVTVAMIVAAILIGITYTAYSLMVKSYRSYTLHQEDIAVLTTLDHVLKRDFEMAGMVWKETDGISLQYPNKIIKYTITPDFILRIAAKTDTFNVQTQDVLTARENNPVADVQETGAENRIDELTFTVIFQTEKTPCAYDKTYSAENLIQNNAYAIH